MLLDASNPNSSTAEYKRFHTEYNVFSWLQNITGENIAKHHQSTVANCWCLLQIETDEVWTPFPYKLTNTALFSVALLLIPSFLIVDIFLLGE